MLVANSGYSMVKWMNLQELFANCTKAAENKIEELLVDKALIEDIKRRCNQQFAKHLDLLVNDIEKSVIYQATEHTGIIIFSLDGWKISLHAKDNDSYIFNVAFGFERQRLRPAYCCDYSLRENRDYFAQAARILLEKNPEAVTTFGCFLDRITKNKKEGNEDIVARLFAKKSG